MQSYKWKSKVSDDHVETETNCGFWYTYQQQLNRPKTSTDESTYPSLSELGLSFQQQRDLRYPSD